MISLICKRTFLELFLIKAPFKIATNVNVINLFYLILIIMKKINFNLVIALFAMIFLFSNSAIFAQEGKKGEKDGKENPKHFKEHRKEMRGLNLTDDQKAKIEKLAVAHLKEMTGLKNQLKEKRAHLITITQVDNPDMNAINKTIDEIGAMRTDVQKKQVAHRLEVRKLLTDEQKIRFDAMPKKMMKKKAKRMEREE